MNTLLFSPFKIKNVELKNRVVMSPMFTHSADEDGNITEWQRVHYGARALGQVGLVFLEAASIAQDSQVGERNLGIWADTHVPGLTAMVELLHSLGAKAGIQLSHAGRSTNAPGAVPMGPSPIPFSEQSPVPREMSQEDMRAVVAQYGAAARRATTSGFDILEIHGAHGGLVNTFLSPLSNQRQDEYGGSPENRYRFLSDVIREVKTHWEGPLFVRISSTDYQEGGNTPASFIPYARLMQADGVDLVDCSSGGIAPVQVTTYPGYQVPAAELIKREVGIATGAVGVILTGQQAEEILQKGQADLVYIGRQILKDPFWPRTAAQELGASIDVPEPYTRYGSKWLVAEPQAGG
ncbi:NADPH dehydrogenase NamA [Hymenobacter profundi]|uniref:NADPH dehydrogenase NamA n=1 Tax=Hymenobacter profundi TaxID=1982110 RepID=A0ABS6X0U3_9BACT|nr:NADPH dehydrogenase NamA [Hymenobacter profundi]MBW3129415.1 NADPH dehydrogenase NamA [Hymenobacter profundi]